MPKMLEMTMPKGSGSGEECGDASGGRVERVEVARAIAPGDHVPGVQVLHRKAKRIKLNETVIIGGKTTNGNQVLNYVWRDQDIVKNNYDAEKKVCDPVAATGRSAPLPTMIDEGVLDEGEKMVESLPASAVI